MVWETGVQSQVKSYQRIKKWYLMPPIMLYNIRYWWFFLFQGNQWTKHLVHPKIQKPKPCLLMFASLVALDSFHLLLSTQLMADLTLDWSGRSMFHPLSHIYAKTPFCSIERVANYALNHWHIVFWLWANAAPTMNTAFSLTNVHAKWWIHHLLISLTPLQSHATLRCKFTISQNKYVEFLVFFRTTAEFGWPECSTSFASVRPNLKSAYHLLTIVSDREESE